MEMTMWVPTDPSGNDALPLEYKLQEGCAFRYLDLSDFVDKPTILRLFRPYEVGLEEQPVRFLRANIGPLLNDPGD